MAARARSRFDMDDPQPQSDVYTGLLGLSLVAMIVSCLLLYLDFSQYGTTKPPTVNVPQPKTKDGVQTGMLPPPLLQLPPPEPVGERPFTRGEDAVVSQPVKPVGGEESQHPTAAQAPTRAPEAPMPVPIADVPIPPPTTEPGPLVPAPQPKAEAPCPTPEPVPVPPSQTPPPAPPLPKSIKQLPN